SGQRLAKQRCCPLTRSSHKPAILECGAQHRFGWDKSKPKRCCAPHSKVGDATRSVASTLPTYTLHPKRSSSVPSGARAWLAPTRANSESTAWCTAGAGVVGSAVRVSVVLVG